jgi:hypothetical protein
VHEDDSVLWRYYNNADTAISKMAMSFTVDIGCEYGGGVHCSHNPNKANFFGAMLYNRVWFDHDLYAVTLGGGFMNNPGRYLVLLPPINGATAFSGTPYFTENPGDRFRAWDMQVAADFTPRPFITFRGEFNYREADVPYFSGAGGVTPPGGNQGSPGSTVSGWTPDLVKVERRLTLAMLVKM